MSVKAKTLQDYPELVKELKDKDLDPSTISSGSSKNLTWICVICNESYERFPYDRIRRNTACPKTLCMLQRRNPNFDIEAYNEKKRRDAIESRIDTIPERSDSDIEEWRDLPQEMQLSKYQISSLGRIKNKDTNIVRNPKTTNDGYIRSGFILDDNTNKSYYFHVLVAKTFIENPENKLTVNHINTDKTDNRIINLEWATHSEQNLRANRKIYKTRGKPINQLSLNGDFIKRWEKAVDVETELDIKAYTISRVLRNLQEQAGGFKWEFCQDKIIENEIWKKVPLGEDYIEVLGSSQGRFNINGYISYGSLAPSGYYQTKIKNIKKDKKFSFQVHRLICMAFHENKENKPIVNHIDEKKDNNKIENLEWVTNSENVIHSLNLKKLNI